MENKPSIPKTILGEWQRCPVCDGDGQILADGFTSLVYQQCPTCSGNRIIQRPEISYDAASKISKLEAELKEKEGRITLLEFNCAYNNEMEDLIHKKSSRIADLEKELEEEKDNHWSTKILYDACKSANEQFQKRISDLTDLLTRISEYMGDKADTIDGEVPGPNTEMSFLSEIKEALEKARTLAK